MDHIDKEDKNTFKEVRSVVENTIAKIRKWKYAKQQYIKPTKELHKAFNHHQKMIKIICALVNLFDQPIRIY